MFENHSQTARSREVLHRGLGLTAQPPSGKRPTDAEQLDRIDDVLSDAPGRDVPRGTAPRPAPRGATGLLAFLLAPARYLQRRTIVLALRAAVAIAVIGGTLIYLAGASPSPFPSSSPSLPSSGQTTSTTSAVLPSTLPLAPLASDPSSLVFLILGADSMEDRGRSDTILLVNLMLDKRKVHILSIPRDMYSHIERPEGVIQDKINHAYRFGGVELVKKSVEYELGIKIDHYGVIDYDLFRKVVDLVGGIPLTVDKRMYYVDRAGGLKVDLQPGEQVLNGDHALQYVRFRHDAMGDVGRIQRQQKFVGAALSKIKDPKIVTYLAYKLPSFLAYVATDVSTQEALSLLWKVKDITAKDLQVRMVPGDGGLMDTPVHKQRLWFFLADKPELEKLRKEWFFNPDALPEQHGPSRKQKKNGKHHASPSPAAATLGGGKSAAPTASPAATVAPASPAHPRSKPAPAPGGKKHPSHSPTPAPVPRASTVPAPAVPSPAGTPALAPSAAPPATPGPSPARAPSDPPITDEASLEEGVADTVGAVILGQATDDEYDSPDGNGP